MSFSPRPLVALEARWRVPGREFVSERTTLLDHPEVGRRLTRARPTSATEAKAQLLDPSGEIQEGQEWLGLYLGSARAGDPTLEDLRSGDVLLEYEPAAGG